jgi:hypothetical protein
MAKKSSFDEPSLIFKKNPIFMAISYQHPMFCGRRFFKEPIKLST